MTKLVHTLLSLDAKLELASVVALGAAGLLWFLYSFFFESPHEQ